LTLIILSYIENIAPVRLGIIGESLTYPENIYKQSPRLRSRQTEVMHRLQYMTHALAGDEHDAYELNQSGRLKALCWVQGIPRWAIRPPNGTPKHTTAFFSGALYGDRINWLQNPLLKGLLEKQTPFEDQAHLPQTFDLANRVITDSLTTSGFSEELLTLHGCALEQIRKRSFTLWLEGLAQGVAVVNLPSFLQAYPGRVFEGMAAGRPVITWEIPDRPLTKVLFEHGKEILMFSQDAPDQLADHIRRLREDRYFAGDLMAAAHNKMLTSHTLEKRTAQLLEWITDGTMPDYSAGSCDRNISEWGTPMNDDYYVQTFTKDPYWSSPTPNAGEYSRWLLIAQHLKVVVPSLSETLQRRPRILEVGSGRGWLTNLLSTFGDSVGIEPVRVVVEQARKLFPDLNFIHGTTQALITPERVGSFDLIVSSEVIEHVPDNEKQQFVKNMYLLLVPGGYLVLTTPRKEVLNHLRQGGFKIDQPVEDWLTENELKDAYVKNGFSPLHLDRIFVHKDTLALMPGDQSGNADSIALYQIWLLRKEARTPRITVIIPTYNRECLLPRAIASVLTQTVSDFELIIVDDGSTDDTQKIVTGMADPRVLYIRHATNQGQNAALNTGVRNAQGEYVAFLDSDDEWLPEYLEHAMEIFRNDGDLSAVYCWAGTLMLDGSIRTVFPFSMSGHIYREALAQGFLSHMITIVVKRDVFATAGMFDTDFTVCQDDDFCFRVAKHFKIGLVQKVLAIVHSDGGEERLITSSKQNYAEGWLKLFTKYRDEILINCGCEALANHYIKCGKLFLNAEDCFKALNSFSLSAQYLDYCIKENLRPPLDSIKQFIPGRETLRGQQIDGLKACALKALQTRA
jgi:glycosyltransferase involved in cell wall biosynthesis/protein-L-isoaspartate O-methyltransferase